jgi:peptidoglycan/xylan/chitin deacetylase (PgdA/CDA1 family)
LAGDETLTLGFDAGLVLPIEPSFNGYVALSAQPQAVALHVTRYIGGDLQTRLYAQRVGEGRFVWMDFSPDAADHYEMLEGRFLDALVAAVFRYLARRDYTAWATWPDGRRFAGVLSVDAEDRFERVGAIAQLARDQHVPITWFVLSNEAQRHRGLLPQLSAVGEIACHGDVHTSFPLGSAASQVVRIARCRKALAEVAHVDVAAFRPPYEEYNDATVDAVANNGMSYYFAESGGDRAVPRIVRSRETDKTLVSLPRIGSDDFEMWEARGLDVQGSIAQADHEFRWAHTLGGLLVFDFHTQLVNSERLQVVAHYARRFRGADVHQATAGSIASWWRLRERLTSDDAIPASDVCEHRPVLLRVDEQGELVRLTTFTAIHAALPEHAMTLSDGWRTAERLCGRS